MGSVNFINLHSPLSLKVQNLHLIDFIRGAKYE